MGLYEDILGQENPYERINPRPQSLYRGGGGRSFDYTRPLSEQEIMNNAAFDEFNRQRQFALDANDPSRVAAMRAYQGRRGPTPAGKVGGYTPPQEAQETIMGGKGGPGVPTPRDPIQNRMSLGGKASGLNPVMDRPQPLGGKGGGPISAPAPQMPPQTVPNPFGPQVFPRR